MSDIVDTIRRVAAFAETKDSMHQAMTDVHFRKGEIFAQSTLGGAVEPADIDLNCGVNARKLLQALKAVGKDPSFEVRDNHFVIHMGRSKAKLGMSSAKNAPAFHRPPPNSAWSPVPMLHEAYRLAWAVSKDSTRSHLGGITLMKTGIGATNGHVALKLGSENYHKVFGTKEDMIIPPAVLKGLASPTFATLADQRIFLADAPDTEAFRSANLFNAMFPPLEQVLVGGRECPRMAVGRKELVDMIKRAKLSANTAALSVTKGRLGIRIDRASETTLFDFADSISFEPASDEPVPMGLVGLNLEYLLQTVEAATSEAIQVGMRPSKDGSLDPVYVIDGALEAVMMPMRL